MRLDRGDRRVLQRQIKPRGKQRELARHRPTGTREPQRQRQCHVPARAISVEDDPRRIVGGREFGINRVGERILARMRRFGYHIVERHSNADCTARDHLGNQRPMHREHRLHKPAAVKIEHVPCARPGLRMQRHHALILHHPLLDDEAAAEALGHRRVFGKQATCHRLGKARGIMRKYRRALGHQPFDSAHHKAGRIAAQFGGVIGQHGLSLKPATCRAGEASQALSICPRCMCPEDCFSRRVSTS